VTRGGVRVGTAYDSPQALYVGEQIKQYREKLGLLQRELAERMHLDPSILSLWEVDRRPVPHPRVEDLATALEVSVEELLGERLEAWHRITYADVLDLPIKPFEPEPEPEEEAIETPVVAIGPPVPDQRLWCDCGGRRHYHGMRPSWSPFVMAIKDLV
jgi:transcriptional regulator with XRE-family HTH domain